MAELIDFKSAKKEQTQRLWQSLLELSALIVSVWPWDFVDEEAQFAYLPPERTDPVFLRCSLAAGGVPRLTLFPSEAAYLAALRPAKTGREKNRLYMETECYTLDFYESSHLKREIQKLYRNYDLLPVEGFWPWPGFKRLGCEPMELSQKQLLFLLDALENFLILFRDMVERHLDLQMEPDKILLRLYDPRQGVWSTLFAPSLPTEQAHYPVQVKNSPQLEALRACPLSMAHPKIDFDFGWLLEPEQEEPQDAPWHYNVVVFADHHTGRPLSVTRCHHKELVDCVFTTLAELIKAQGRPETICLCRDESQDLLEDFSDKLGLSLKRLKALPNIKSIFVDCGAV